MDIMREVIADIEERDHKVFTLEPGEELAEEIWELMEADNYKFACSPARDKGSSERNIYFVRRVEPALRM
jgi:hypothetical protein